MGFESSAKILLEECPSFTDRGFDTDIELYTSLIGDKKYVLAKSLYEKKLIPRYPDEAVRIRIIRYFRKNDYRFKEIYGSAVKELHHRIILSVKKLIDYISSIFEENTSNPYELLRRIDKAQHVIPSEKTAAIRFIRKLSRYSVLLNHRTESYAKAYDILTRYYDNTLFVKRIVPKKVKKKEISQEYKPEKKKNKITIDLDAVEFSDQDIAMICINPAITKRTYKVLAYCRLYWKQIHNQDFEKKIFLYSRKYNTLHFKIFTFVKNGRIKKLGDDVILLELYSLISRGYRYSVHEDLLMQKIWRKIKPVDVLKRKKQGDGGSVSAGFGKSGSRTTGIDKAAVKTGTIGGTIGDGSRKNAAAKQKITVRKNKIIKPGKKQLRINEIHRQSLKKKLDLLSFRDVFDAHEVFSSLLPGYIEKYIVRHRKKGSGKDPYIQKGALYIIQNFVKNNYDSLTYDWNSSIEKQEVANIGFLVPEIDTIIAMCLEEVRMRRATV